MKFATRNSAFVTLATLLGFAARLPLLGDVPPRWDEGWSIAHASLSLSEIFTITSADVHPPLYYLSLSAWQQLIGINLFAARYLSVLLGVTAIPLIYVAARIWSRSQRLAVLAAFLMAWLPLGVYYGAVVRMYALAPPFVLLATYGGVLRLAHCVTGDTRFAIRHAILFVTGAVGAMLTLYHAVWALTALAVYALATARGPRAVRWVVSAVGAAVIVYLPWAIYAAPQLFGRAAAESATNIGQRYPLTYFIRQGLYDLTMSQQVGDLGLAVIGGIMTTALVAALVAALVRGARPILLLLPGLTIVFTLVGVAFAARQWAFNARMLICAVPALALALAWAFEQFLKTDDCRSSSRVGRLAAGGAALALIGVYFTTSTDFVYRKTLEVFDPYNPNTYHQNIAPKAQPDDLVLFNVLSPAGFYALDRDAHDPRWSYALTWDPVIEPPARWQARITEAATQHDRLWLVLYRGLAGTNGDLRGYMDSNFYPAHAEWGEEEVFYGLYGVASSPLAPVDVGTAQWGDVHLIDARIGAQVRPGSVIPVALQWQALGPIETNYKVFVHAVSPDGRLIAQHDAQPLNDLRPMTTWGVNQVVHDNHGLALPRDYAGRLKLQLGLYHPDTGERLKNGQGREAVTLGEVTIAP